MRSCQGTARTGYGSKLIRVNARPQYGETLWEDVIQGNRGECLDLATLAVGEGERLFAIAGEGKEVSPAARVIWSRIEWRLDSGWGTDTIISYLLGRGSQVTGKLHTHTRIKRLATTIEIWQPALQTGRELPLVPEPVVYARPVQQLAVRTPSTRKEGGWAHAVFLSSRTELAPLQVVAHYDDRAGIEADLKSDKRGLGMVSIRKRQLAARRLVVLLIDLAHNVLTWKRSWLAPDEWIRVVARLGTGCRFQPG